MSVYYKWFRKLFGYSKIKIHAPAEEIINALSEKRVYFWDTQVDENGDVYICGSVFSASEIIDVATSLGFEANPCERVGLPFLFEKYKRRYGIMVGLILAWAIIFLSSLTIWDVRIAERSGEDPEKIKMLLKECGLEMGTFLPTLNVRAVENQFLLNNDEYSFLAVNVCGTVANVEIRRASKKGETEDKSQLCDVVASRDGTIISVEAYGGKPVVKKGDNVSEGDMLISSFMEGSFGVQRAVHAYGKVMAAVGYEYETEISLDGEIVSRTGRKSSKSSVSVLPFKLNLFKDEKSPFQRSDVENVREKVELFGIKLPLEINKTIYYETEKETLKLTRSEAEKRALKDYEMYKSREIKGGILSETYECYFDEEKSLCILKGYLTVEEDIGVKKYWE